MHQVELKKKIIIADFMESDISHEDKLTKFSSACRCSK